MKEAKLKKLFAAARQETAPEVPFSFSQSVRAALRREQNQIGIFSLADQLSRLFPRLAWAAVLLIGACVLGEVYFAKAADRVATTEVTQAAEEWLYASN